MPVIVSVWPPETMCRTFFSLLTWAIACATPEFTSPIRKDLIALDQLARLLHAGADVVGRILDKQFERTPENAACGVDLVDRELGAHHFVLRDRGIDAGQGIDHADA